VTRVELRYFEIRGRGQPLRDLLLEAAAADATLVFEDLQLSFGDWDRRQQDAEISGAYRALPTLSWDGQVLQETLPIATFLSARLGHYGGRDALAIARLEAISSLCFTDIAATIGLILWAEVDFPGVDLAQAYPRNLSRILAKLASLDASAPEQGWFGGAQPVASDFFALEAWESLCQLLGARAAALPARFSRLHALAERTRARPALARGWAARPARCSGNPDEPDVLARLGRVDLSRLGF
jgi:hypothetical protein